jgi:hypothetical protein
LRFKVLAKKLIGKNKKGTNNVRRHGDVAKFAKCYELSILVVGEASTHPCSHLL